MRKLIGALCLVAAGIAACARIEEDTGLVGAWEATFQVDTAFLEIPQQFSGSLAIRRRTQSDTAFVGLEPELFGSSTTVPDGIAYAGPSGEDAERLGLPAHWWRDTYAWTGPRDSVRIRINPHGSTGGIELSGRISGNRIAGKWLIPGEAPLAVGRFSMARVAR